MPYRKKTLRKMPPKTRAIAYLIGELESVTTRLKNRLGQIEEMEIAERALASHRCDQQGVAYVLGLQHAPTPPFEDYDDD